MSLSCFFLYEVILMIGAGGQAANVLVDDTIRCVISDFGQSEMKSEAYRISGTTPPRMFTLFLGLLDSLMIYCRLRWDTALAGTGVDVGAEPAGVDATDGRVRIRDLLRGNLVHGKDAMATSGRRRRSAYRA